MQRGRHRAAIIASTEQVPQRCTSNAAACRTRQGGGVDGQRLGPRDRWPSPLLEPAESTWRSGVLPDRGLEKASEVTTQRFGERPERRTATTYLVRKVQPDGSEMW